MESEIDQLVYPIRLRDEEFYLKILLAYSYWYNIYYILLVLYNNNNKNVGYLLNFQAVIKQFSGTGYESSDVMVIDEIEMHRHQQLEKLYRSTRAGKV